MTTLVSRTITNKASLRVKDKTDRPFCLIFLVMHFCLGLAMIYCVNLNHRAAER